MDLGDHMVNFRRKHFILLRYVAVFTAVIGSLPNQRFQLSVHGHEPRLAVFSVRRDRSINTESKAPTLQ